jgi:glycosyltransferase involved in cell wall biosynthesis
MDVFRPTNANEVLRLRNMHGIAEDALLVLFVAALDRAHHFKGLDRLLDAFAHLHGESVSAARLLVVGDGDLRSQYEARARELGLSKRAIFVGSLAHEATAAYFAAADVTVLPSSPPESFGLVLIESMACATPVIASDIPGVRTVVQDQIDGLLVEQANIDALTDALDTMLSLPQADHNTMGAKGMSKVRCRYTWSRIGMQLQNIYCDLLETNRSMGSRYMETAIRRPKQRA